MNTIKVGWTDILLGKRGTAFDCAIARAMKRSGMDNPEVRPDFICWNDGGTGQLMWTPTPEPVKEFISTFDSKGWMKSRPASMELAPMIGGSFPCATLVFADCD